MGFAVNIILYQLLLTGDMCHECVGKRGHHDAWFNIMGMLNFLIRTYYLCDMASNSASERPVPEIQRSITSLLHAPAS